MVGPGADCFGVKDRFEFLDVLKSGHLARLVEVDDPAFKHKVFDLEKEFAASCGTSHALATNSGTSALLLSLLALGIGEGDEVLVPGFTYVATYAAIIHARATPVLVEIDASLTIDPDDLERKVTSRSKAVIVVHMLGNPCDMSAVMCHLWHGDPGVQKALPVQGDGAGAGAEFDVTSSWLIRAPGSILFQPLQDDIRWRGRHDHHARRTLV